MVQRLIYEYFHTTKIIKSDLPLDNDRNPYVKPKSAQKSLHDYWKTAKHADADDWDLWYWHRNQQRRRFAKYCGER